MPCLDFGVGTLIQSGSVMFFFFFTKSSVSTRLFVYARPCKALLVYCLCLSVQGASVSRCSLVVRKFHEFL